MKTAREPSRTSSARRGGGQYFSDRVNTNQQFAYEGHHYINLGAGGGGAGATCLAIFMYFTRELERQRKIQRETEKETERKGEREIQRERERKTDRHIERQTERDLECKDQIGRSPRRRNALAWCLGDLSPGSSPVPGVYPEACI